MTAAVFGTYENGRVTLNEALPVKTGKAKVLVTVVEEVTDGVTFDEALRSSSVFTETLKESGHSPKPKRKLGMLKGVFTGEYWYSKEFNDPINDLKEYM